MLLPLLLLHAVISFTAQLDTVEGHLLISSPPGLWLCLIWSAWLGSSSVTSRFVTSLPLQPATAAAALFFSCCQPESDQHPDWDISDQQTPPASFSSKLIGLKTTVSSRRRCKDSQGPASDSNDPAPGIRINPADMQGNKHSSTSPPWSPTPGPLEIRFGKHQIQYLGEKICFGADRMQLGLNNDVGEHTWTSISWWIFIRRCSTAGVSTRTLVKADWYQWSNTDCSSGSRWWSERKTHAGRKTDWKKDAKLRFIVDIRSQLFDCRGQNGMKVLPERPEEQQMNGLLW